MEKNIHRVRLRVFFREDELGKRSGSDCNEGDNEEEVKVVESKYCFEENYDKLMSFSESELEKMDITNKNSGGLIIREVIITKNKLCNKFFANLLTVLCENKEAFQTLLKELDLYIDEQFFDFYIRLDKETLMPVTGGNCFHIKITPAAFPKTRENVKKKMLELFENKTE